MHGKYCRFDMHKHHMHSKIPFNFFFLKKKDLKNVIWFHRVWHETRMQYEHTCISLWFKDYWCWKTGILLHTTFFWIHLASKGIKMDSWKLRRIKMSWRHLLLNCFEIHFTSIEKKSFLIFCLIWLTYMYYVKIIIEIIKRSWFFVMSVKMFWTETPKHYGMSKFGFD